MSGLADLQRLYDSEINFTLSTFWDGGIDWQLGDGRYEQGTEDTISAAVDRLITAACRCFPNSIYAKQKRQELS